MVIHLVTHGIYKKTWEVHRMHRDAVKALVVYILLFIVFFILSIGFGLGEAESRHDPSSALLYVRRATMIIAAVVFLGLTRKENREALGLTVSMKWIAIAVLVGFAMGFSNPGGFDPTEPVALILALFHTFAMELFFRGYLFRTFSASMEGLLKPLFLSSFCYGLFYLTTGPIWANPPGAKVVFVLLFSLVGAAFAYGYKRSGSFMVPWLMHFFGVLKYRMLF